MPDLQMRKERRSRCRRCGATAWEVWGLVHVTDLLDDWRQRYEVVIVCEECYVDSGLVLAVSERERERLEKRGLRPVTTELKHPWHLPGVYSSLASRFVI